MGLEIIFKLLNSHFGFHIEIFQSQLTCLVTYWSNTANKFQQFCFHFLTSKKSARQDYFFALNVILGKVQQMDEFKPTRIVKVCDGCASENRSSHVLSHLVKTIDHTVAYKVILIKKINIQMFLDKWSWQR